MKRAAFSFIELVFSIVIVGLVILSIPLIVRQSNANTIESQNVLGYYNALTLMETIKGKPWDVASVADFEKSGEYYILLTDDVLQCTKRDNIWTKKGLGNADRRRMCDPGTPADPTPRRAQAIAGNANLESIGAFNGFNSVIRGVGGAGFFRLRVGVSYAAVDFAAGTLTPVNGKTTDVKAITVELSRIAPDSSEEVVSTYTYYAANIGMDVPFSKDNQ